MDSDIFNNPYVIISILFIGAQYVIRPFIELITQRDKKDAVVEQRETENERAQISVWQTIVTSMANNIDRSTMAFDRIASRLERIEGQQLATTRILDEYPVELARRFEGTNRLITDRTDKIIGKEDDAAAAIHQIRIDVEGVREKCDVIITILRDNEQRLIALTKPPDKPIDLSGQQPSVKPPETLPPHVIPAPASL